MEKTCGNCYYSLPRKYGHWTTNDLICLRHAVSTCSERHHITECGWGIDGPKGWRPKDKHTLEQRYQQLAEVAQEMWHYVVAHNTPNVPGVDMSGFEERLEELGVEV